MMVKGFGAYTFQSTSRANEQSQTEPSFDAFELALAC